MHILHHVPLFHFQFQNSLKYVAPCVSCGVCTTIETHRNFWIFTHNHQTKSNVVPSIYFYPSADCKTWKVVLYKTQVITTAITCEKVILLQCNPFFFPISIGDMDHYVDLVWVMILNLNLILQLKSVVLHKIDHW